MGSMSEIKFSEEKRMRENMQNYKEKVNELTVEFIRQDKESKGISNLELAEVMSIPGETVSRYLTGSIKIPVWFVTAYFVYTHASEETVLNYFNLVSEVKL